MIYIHNMYIHTHDIKSTLPEGSLFLEDLGVPWHMLLKQLVMLTRHGSMGTERKNLHAWADFYGKWLISRYIYIIYPSHEAKR